MNDLIERPMREMRNYIRQEGLGNIGLEWLSALEQQAGEIEALTEERDLNVRQCDFYKAEVDRLKAENAELRKDADRYLWLRSEGENLPDDFPVVRMFDDNRLLLGEELDAAIDAAMEGKK